MFSSELKTTDKRMTERAFWKGKQLFLLFVWISAALSRVGLPGQPPVIGLSCFLPNSVTVICQFSDLRRQKCCFCVSLCLTLWALVKCNREKKCWGWFNLLLCSNGTKHTGVYGRGESAAVFFSFPRRLTPLQHPLTLVILTISINTQRKTVGATMLVTE